MLTKIEKLRRLEASKNGGRGVSCVRLIIFYYFRSDYASMRAVLINEGDKLHNYPDLVVLINELLTECDSMQTGG